MNHSAIIIQQLRSGETIDFAAAELEKYLKQMAPGVSVISNKQAALTGQEIQIGLFADFTGKNLVKVTDPRIDDAVFIEVQKGRGIIAGINPCSVLLAVYRFLTEAGCRWVRPGADGEMIPRKELDQINVTVSESAAYRHRGICIEGAVSYENVAEIIDWLPKVGFNSYFIQFREAFAFFVSWYTRRNNPLKVGRSFTVAEARELVARAELEIQKRSLSYHAVGHGWTCEPFGIPGLSWDQRLTEVPPETAQYLAEVNGERAVWQGIPLNTNLCYSNAEVRRKLTDDIIAYIGQHPMIQALHVWLADDKNNHCECTECQKAIPSDWYTLMLNELDERLTAAGLSTKIVFLIYFDLLWPPRQYRFHHQERFILMFAPITRSYDRPFENGDTSQEIPSYVRNRLEFPRTAKENLLYLKAWQRVFEGDAFDFDYHLMWAHYYDPAYYQIARVLHEDVKNLKIFGLNGLISCQAQRSFAPTGLPVYVLARTLWNDRLSFEEIAADYFQSAFGPAGTVCWQYLAQLPNLLSEISSFWADEFRFDAVRLQAGKETVAKLMALAQADPVTDNDNQAKSWEYLRFSMEVAGLFIELFSARANNESKQVAEIWESLKQFIREQEDEVQPVFDVYEYIFALETISPKVLGIERGNE